MIKIKNYLITGIISIIPIYLTYWIIENPRGKLRKLEIVKDLPRTTVTYCQYGDIRMKPTDLWTNLIEDVSLDCSFPLTEGTTQ